MTDLAGNSVLKRIGKGVGGLSINAAVNILGQVAIVPIAMHAWGKTRYGEWVTISGLVLFLKLSELGLQNYVMNLMCEAYTRGERDSLQHILNNSLRVQLALVLSLFSLIAIALWVSHPEVVFNIQTAGRTEVSISFLCLSAELLLRIPMGVVAGIYRATGKLPRAAIVGAWQDFTLLVLMCLLIATNVSFSIVAGTRLLIAILFSLWILRDIKRLYPWINLSLWQGDWAKGAQMILPGLFFLLIPLADFLANQVTLIFLQKQLGGSEVSRLATHRTAINLAQMVSGLLTNAIWPELTSLYSSGKKEQLAKLYHGLVKLNIWFVVAVTFGLLPFLSILYSTWTAKQLVLDRWTLAFLVLRVVTWGSWSASATLLYAINQQKLIAVVQFGAALITSTLAFFLIPLFGIRGAALAACLSDIALCAWVVPYWTARAIDENVSLYWSKAVLPIGLGLTLPILLGSLAWNYFDPAPLRYLVVLPLSILLGLLLSWRALTDHERVLIHKISQRFHQLVFA